MVMSTIPLIRGQTARWAMVFLQNGEGSSPINLTGATVSAEIVELSRPVSVVVNNPTSGAATLSMGVGDNWRPGPYSLSIRVELAGGDVLIWPPVRLMVR